MNETSENYNKDKDKSRPSWTSLLGVGSVIVFQFLAGITWLSTEHSARVELERRFNTFQSDQTERITGVTRVFEASQTNQDANIRRHEETIHRLDTQGGRQLGIVTEKQQFIFEIIKDIQRDIELLRREHMKGSEKK